MFEDSIFEDRPKVTTNPSDNLKISVKDIRQVFEMKPKQHNTLQERNMMVFKNGIDESDLPCCPNSSLEKGEGGGLSLSSSLRQSTISHFNGDLGEIGLGCGKCEDQQIKN